MPGFDYQGRFAYSLTLVTRTRATIFTADNIVTPCIEAMNRSLESYDFTLYAFCFMPDHLHLLVSGDDSSSLLRFAQHFKQLSGFAYKKTTGANLWQISYWDRVLRSDEDLNSAARYIWGNPVRAGLVEDPRVYAFSGPKPLPEVWSRRASALQLLRWAPQFLSPPD